MFTLKFDTDNAAFGEPGQWPDGQEVSRILRDVAQEIENGETSGNVRDINGNKVGQYALTR